MPAQNQQGVFSRLLRTLAAQYCRVSADLLKIKAAELHLRTVQAVRQSVIGLLGMVACVLLFLTGFGMAHVAIILFAGWTTFQAALFLAICAGVYMLIPIVLLARGLSSRKWMASTRCDKTLHDVADALQPRE